MVRRGSGAATAIRRTPRTISELAHLVALGLLSKYAAAEEALERRDLGLCDECDAMAEAEERYALCRRCREEAIG